MNELLVIGGAALIGAAIYGAKALWSRKKSIWKKSDDKKLFVIYPPPADKSHQNTFYFVHKIPEAPVCKEPSPNSDCCVLGKLVKTRLERMRELRSVAVRRNSPTIFDIYRPAAGLQKVRILPAAPEGFLHTNMAFVRRKQHYVNGLGGGAAIQCNKRFYHNVATQHDGHWVGDCAICDHVQSMWSKHSRNTGELAEIFREEAVRCKGMERVYFNVSVYDQQTKSWGKPQVWSTGLILSRDIMAQIEEFNNEGIDMLDPRTGYDIKISRTEAVPGGYPRFDVIPCRGSRSIGDDKEIETMLANLWDLQAVTTNWEKSVFVLNQAVREQTGAVMDKVHALEQSRLNKTKQQEAIDNSFM